MSMENVQKIIDHYLFNVRQEKERIKNTDYGNSVYWLVEHNMYKLKVEGETYSISFASSLFGHGIPSLGIVVRNTKGESVKFNAEGKIK